MAFLKECQGQGCGTFIISVVVGLAHKLNKQGIGCRFITVDAYPERIDFYIKRGFKHNIHKDYQTRAHPSLKLDVWNWLYESGKNKEYNSLLK
ncbi:MAG: hypothetical protein A3D27_00100 [Omnitrophica WOR_2 bacterium RIFCSPHIGHO2_02_FULL_46_37]|nr:MAG: hypothetical protein A3D27_00100 [Omnitrophica WOR_2 bacterium RIFCSPHIGHO2_02_FULL_46_37]OGX43988.1 MAG: hypothetical protein A3H41_01890 [Omnitrophica WOR_2 bacterium RIFCSPLOWO2_02_FULL_45_28]